MAPIVDLFSSGGPVMFFIAGASLLAWYLALRTWIQAGSLLKRLQTISIRALQSSSEREINAPPPGSARDSVDSVSGGYRFHKFAIESQSRRLGSSLWLVGTLASVLPLLGLLGTVLGMLVSFEVIQGHGTTRPRLLAGGIGQALITTQAGLWTAVPVLFFHHIIRSRVRLISNETEVLSHAIETKSADGSTDPAMKARVKATRDAGQVTLTGEQ